MVEIPGKPLHSATWYWLNSLFFTDENTVYVAGSNGTILKTTNGLYVGTENLPENNLLFSIYPNPASDYISLVPLKESVTKYSTSIFDMQGNLLQKWELNPMILSKRLDISSLPSGLYLIRIQSDSQSESHKLLIN